VTVPATLRPYVEALHVYDVDLGAPGIHRGLPATTLTFVLPVDDPLDVSWADGSDRRIEWSSLSGLHSCPAAIHHSGHQRGVQLALTVAGARALFGMPAAAWSGELLTLDEVAPELGALPERLAETRPSEWEAVLAHELVEALSRHGEPGPRAEVGRALALLSGGVGVAEVADDVGYSRRRLGDLVRAETGLAPKGYQRLARFESVCRLLGRRPLAEVAARCGYADQAHLTREFREFAGCTPTTWLRDEFPYVQDHAGGEDAE